MMKNAAAGWEKSENPKKNSFHFTLDTLLIQGECWIHFEVIRIHLGDFQLISTAIDLSEKAHVKLHKRWNFLYRQEMFAKSIRSLHFARLFEIPPIFTQRSEHRQCKFNLILTYEMSLTASWGEWDRKSVWTLHNVADRSYVTYVTSSTSNIDKSLSKKARSFHLPFCVERVSFIWICILNEFFNQIATQTKLCLPCYAQFVLPIEIL